jgi:hypothetical protein
MRPKRPRSPSVGSSRQPAKRARQKQTLPPQAVAAPPVPPLRPADALFIPENALLICEQLLLDDSSNDKDNSGRRALARAARTCGRWWRLAEELPWRETPFRALVKPAQLPLADPQRCTALSRLARRLPLTSARQPRRRRRRVPDAPRPDAASEPQ